MPPSPPSSDLRGDDRPSPTVSVVLPVLNDEDNLPHVLDGLPGVDEVVVVDGGSTDDTVAVAREMRPDAVLVRPTRSGKGNALICGFAASTGDIVVTLNADGGTDPGELPRYVRALLAGAEVAHGSRYREGGVNLAAHRLDRLGDAVLSRLVNGLFGTRFTDLTSGYNAYWRESLAALDLPGTDLPGVRRGRTVWGDGDEIIPLINIRAATQGLRVVEVASVGYPRIHGAAGRHRLRRALLALRALVTEYLRRRRLERRPPAPARHDATTGTGNRYAVRPSARPAPSRTVRPPAPDPAPYVAGERSTGRHAAHADPGPGRAAHPGNRPTPSRYQAAELPAMPRREGTGRRRGYPDPAPWTAPPPGAHRTRDVGEHHTGVRRSGIYDTGVHHLDPERISRHDTGVHRTGVYDTAVRRSAVYDTGVHRLGAYDSGVHRTDVYESGVHHLPEDGDGAVYRPTVPREVGGGRRRLDARDRRADGRPDLTVIPGEGGAAEAGRSGRLRALPGERFTR